MSEKQFVETFLKMQRLARSVLKPLKEHSLTRPEPSLKVPALKRCVVLLKGLNLAPWEILGLL